MKATSHLKSPIFTWKTCFAGAICLAAMVLCAFAGAQTTPRARSSFAVTRNAGVSLARSPAKQLAYPMSLHGMNFAVDQNVKAVILSGEKQSRVVKPPDKASPIKTAKTGSITGMVETDQDKHGRKLAKQLTVRTGSFKAGGGNRRPVIAPVKKWFDLKSVKGG